MAKAHRKDWTCAKCLRAFRLTLVTARAQEMGPFVRPTGLDSRCPICGRFEVHVAPDAEDTVIAVTYDLMN